MPTRPHVLAVSPGDPLGIGPEITVRAIHTFLKHTTHLRYLVFGSHGLLEAAAELSGLAPFWSVTANPPRQWPRRERVIVVDDGALNPESLLPLPPAPTAEGGRVSLQWVEQAIRSARGSTRAAVRADAIVTAPISKTSWLLAGERRYPGHTELLADRFKARRHGMLFIGPSLRIMLATIHIPLAEVPKAITTAGVLQKILLTAEACESMGIRNPRIGICGLNPHAGEGGLIGDEDDRIIAPAVKAAQRKRVLAAGPLAADTIFSTAILDARGRGAKFDAVVAMYHDQGLIPIKTLDGMKAVNLTVGLPVIRTSPAHGTAFDIAWGAGKADPTSMIEAIGLAASAGS